MVETQQNIIKKPKPYSLPPELQAVVGSEKIPLYILIAFWALLQNRPVTVRDVRMTFNISLRRASDFLEYLTEQGSDVVEAECFMVPSPRGKKCLCRAWRVTEIRQMPVLLSSVMESTSYPVNFPQPNQCTGIFRGMTATDNKCVIQKVNDVLAEKLEEQGMWRRAAARWLEVMHKCNIDAEFEWVSRRRRYCFSRLMPISSRNKLHAENINCADQNGHNSVFST